MIWRFWLWVDPVNRADFQKLARTRLREALHLLKGGLNDGAYYLGGYAVECALKACYARRTRRFDFPPEDREYKTAYSHELGKLATIAGVRGELEQAGTKLASNWTTVQRWSHHSRYRPVTKQQAEELLAAISERRDGVFVCLRKLW